MSKECFDNQEIVLYAFDDGHELTFKVDLIFDFEGYDPGDGYGRGSDYGWDAPSGGCCTLISAVLSDTKESILFLMKKDPKFLESVEQEFYERIANNE